MTPEDKEFAELCGAMHPVAEGVVCDLIKGHQGDHQSGEITEVPFYDWKEDKNVHHLHGQPRPTVEQVAWVFAHLDDTLCEPGTYRQLIYHRLGFDYRAYSPLLCAGGMNISNAFDDLEQYVIKFGSIDGDGVYAPELKNNPVRSETEKEIPQNGGENGKERDDGELCDAGDDGDP